MIDRDLVRRVEHTVSEEAATIAAPLAELALELKPMAADLAGGQLVLLGPGMYINRALGMCLDEDLTTDDLDRLEELSARTGVPAEIEACPWARPSLLALTADRGYRAASFLSTLLRAVGPEDGEADPSEVTVAEVTDDASLAVWQRLTSEGFGHATAEERRIGELFSRAISALESTTLLVASLDGEPVGAAKLGVRDGLALLGGMSTVPSARRRGVQSALIRERLRRAARAGCDLAHTTTNPGSISERNLVRHGFGVAYTRLELRLDASDASDGRQSPRRSRRRERPPAPSGAG